MGVVVDTSAGRVRGRSADGVTAFLGIPYAAPPIGPLRFAAPAPPAPWPGVREATRPGPAAPQPPSRLEHVMGPMAMPQSEDCLSLNVWTPDAGGRRPVLVWMHGGAFSSGSGGAPWYSGAGLAVDGDLVVVTFNYRLGALGFLGLGDDIAPGNAGVRDTLAALRWVRDNIAAFGGDPDRVTFGGQSAGALTGLFLLSNPDAAGMFGRAILQSTPTAAPPTTPGRAAEAADRFLHALGITREHADRLRAEPVARLLDAQADVGRAMARPLVLAPAFQPTAEPGLVAADPMAALDGAPTIDLLAGITRDEACAWPVADGIDDHRAAEIAGGFGGDAARQAYTRARDAEPDVDAVHLLAGVATGHYFGRDLPRLGRGQYVYSFDWHPDGSPLGACHCIELPFLLGDPPAWRHAPMIGDGAPRHLVTTVRAAWSSFVHTGDPGPSWRRYHDASDTAHLA